MSAQAARSASPDQSDRLLWLAAAVLALLGASWLVISQPWSASELEASSEPSSAPLITAAPESGGTVVATPAQAGLDNPLRMAQLAYEAGMLVEPDNYSAWTLFARALAEDPGNLAAQQGLEAVAGELLKRAAAALEQGRFDDAELAVNRILAVLPKHAPAATLHEKITASAAEPAPAPRVAVEPVRPEIDTRRRQGEVSPPRVESARTPAPRAATPPVDRVAEHHGAFQLAMRSNRLLTPADDNAKAHVEALLAANPQHELTLSAQSILAEELLSRSKQALEALDADAARSWIDAAESISADAVALAAARARLDEQLISMESAKPLPASELTIREYVAPDYPGRALARGIEGWVDVEFIVATNGSTREVVAAEASHDRLFRNEAVEAVSQWQFEPRDFLGRFIEQRSYARIRFTLTE